MKHLLLFTITILFVSLKLVFAQESPKKEVEDEIRIIADENAEPEGGMEVFYGHIGENLKYPQKAKEEGIEGKVYVQFIVEKDGSFSEIKAIKGLHPDCDEEAIRIFTEYNENKNAPKWKSAKERGKPIRQKVVIPINFKIK